MFRRRQLGPAYERSPLELLRDWSMRNLLALAGAGLGCIVFLFVFNYFVEDLLNFMVMGGVTNKELVFSADSGGAVILKLLLAAGVAWAILRTQTK